MAIITIFLLINFLRKLHWDTIHNNLIELVESIGGKVIRKGILSRPFYHGDYKGNALTINFSSERTKKGRLNYIDISLSKKLKSSLTISSLSWLRERQEDSINDFEPLSSDGILNYGIKKKKNLRFVHKNRYKEFIQNIQKLDPFNFIYIGEMGILFERQCENIAISTKHPIPQELVETLVNLTKIIL